MTIWDVHGCHIFEKQMIGKMMLLSFHSGVTMAVWDCYEWRVYDIIMVGDDLCEWM